MAGREFVDPPSRTWEDFAAGDVVLTRGRTVDIGDITQFAGLTGDMYPIHIDHESAKDGHFGGRIAHGPLTFSLAVGLVGMTNFYGDAIVALLGIDGLRAKKPVLPGDTLRVRAEATKVEAGRNPKYGTLEMTYVVLNQRDEEVMQFVQTMLAKRRQEGGADE